MSVFRPRLFQQPPPEISTKVLCIALGMLTLSVLLFAPITLGFAETTGGHLPFDNQFPLTVDKMFAQLPLYTEQTLHWYYAFFAVDLVFPLLFSSCFALLWLWLLQRRDDALAITLLGSSIALLPYLSTVLDWMENVCNLVVITGFPDLEVIAARFAISFKNAKLVALGANFTVTLILLWPTRDTGGT